MQYKINLEAILAEKEKCLKDLQDKHATLSFELNVERSKKKALEKDRVSFKASCKSLANQEASSLNLTIATLKANAKSTKRSKQDLLKLKDIKYKDTFTLYQKNLKANTKLNDQVQGLYKKINLQILSISNLNGDLIAKICEVDILKKENKVMSSKVASLERKLIEVNKKKMEHAIQMRTLAKEMEEIKVRNFEQTKVLRERTNEIDHKRKLETIEFVAST